MKISRMHLFAYGPFTDAVLDFSASSTDFHMIYGPNEAGKSTALRALRHMLFGIPVRTPDSFLHPNPTLRIGAHLSKSDGSMIEFVRRKAQSKTLRGPDDETLLDDDALVPFLGGISQEIFEQMFAIGHEDLIAGGQEIISGEGSVGEALFSAGAGLIQLRSVQQYLESGCDELFKPSGSVPKINAAMSSLKEIRKSQKDALLPARVWKSHHQALSNAQQRLERVRQERDQAKQKINKRERIRTALPLIVRKKELDASLLEDEGVPDLPETFSETRRETENEHRIALQDLNRVAETLQRLKGEMDALQMPGDLLQQAAMIEGLQQELGAYRKGQKDRPNLEGRMRTLEKQASDMLSEIGTGILPDLEKELKLPPAIVGEIQDMGKTFEQLTTRLETAREHHRKLETQLGKLTARKKSLTAPVDITALKIALQAAQEAGPIERQLAQIRATLQSRERATDNAIKRLPIWSGTQEELDTLSCPTKESADQFEIRFNETAREAERREEEKRLAEKEIAEIESELQAIEHSHDVPTEIDLETSRSIRQDGWRLIRDVLEGKDPSDEEIRTFTDQFEHQTRLPDAFEKGMERADSVADRLRRESEQVSRKGMLESRKHLRGKDIQALDKAIGAARKKQAALDEEWERLWVSANISPLSPKEMRGWLADVESVREKISDMLSVTSEADALVSEAETLRSRLIAALTDVDVATDEKDSLAKLSGVAKVHVESQEELQSQTESIEKNILEQGKEKDEAENTVKGLEENLDQWKDKWSGHVERIGLDADASPMAAMTVIDSIREAKGLIDEADVLRKRIEGIDRDADAFRDQVDNLVTDLAPDLEDQPRDRAAILLNTRLTEARGLLSKKNTLDKQFTGAEKEQKAATKRIDNARTALDSLCREAHCENPEDLEAIEKRSQRCKEMTSSRNDLESRLRDLSAGESIEAFTAEAASAEADSITPELEELERQIEDLEQERSALDQTIGTEKAELNRMDGSAEAAEYAEDAERLLASLESDVEQYARFKIAAVILARTIEQYREKHQGPLIKRASELFCQITMDAFSGIRAEYDDKGQPVLVGIRPVSGQLVMVTGMSDGTADQLYLALRLASLEQYLENNEPLPFVVDDILLRFDDQRALATLNVLSELSQKTQVIFFTHHQHLVDLAEKNIDSSALFKHVI